MTIQPRLLQLLAAHGQAPGQTQMRAPGSRLAKAMMSKSTQARMASLAALPPYGHSKHADSFGYTAQADAGAYQNDAFQDDAFQVT